MASFCGRNGFSRCRGGEYLKKYLASVLRSDATAPTRRISSCKESSSAEGHGRKEAERVRCVTVQGRGGEAYFPAIYTHILIIISGPFDQRQRKSWDKCNEVGPEVNIFFHLFSSTYPRQPSNSRPLNTILTMCDSGRQQHSDIFVFCWSTFFPLPCTPCR